MKVVVGGIFLHDVLGYVGVFQSLHQGVHYNLVHVGGLTHLYVKVAVSCRALKPAQVQPDALRSLLAPPWYFSSLGGAGGLCVKCSRVRFLSWQDLWWLTC